MNEKEISKKAVVGGVLSMDSGRRFGFKTSFEDIEEAMVMKKCIVGFLEGKGYVVRCEKVYHE